MWLKNIDVYQGKKGFTLVEIMIVVAIVALLAAIAIPNLLRAKVTSNDALAKSALKALAVASETFTNFNNGNYPTDISSLTGANPSYVNTPYCGTTTSGFIYTCSFASTGYTLTATPSLVGSTGSTTFTVTTGGILSP